MDIYNILKDSKYILKYYSFKEDINYCTLKLEKLKETLHTRFSKPTLSDILFFMADAMLALQSIHELGVFHRDLKPDNIGYAVDGSLKLFDFGLSFIVDKMDENKQKMCVGTLKYMSHRVHINYKYGAKDDLISIAYIGMSYWKKLPWDSNTIMKTDKQHLPDSIYLEKISFDTSEYPKILVDFYGYCKDELTDTDIPHYRLWSMIFKSRAEMCLQK